MRNAGLMLIAAILGSLLTTGIFAVLDDKNEPVRIEYVQRTPVHRASLTGNAANAPLDFTAVAEKVMPAVVHIKSTQKYERQQRGYRPNVPHPFEEFFGHDFFRDFFGPGYRGNSAGPMLRVGSGSGVIISNDGYIVTNNHVVEDADELEVTLYDNRTFNATVVGTDPLTDIALIKIDEKGLPSLPLDDSDKARVGEWVLAVGNPFNLNSTVTAGIISATGRNINILRDEYAIESFIQTDAAINQGNSGGALVNMNGGLIGINTAIASPTGYYSGYGFAVPSNMVKKVVEDLIEYGEVQRGTLGIMIMTVNSAIKEEKNLDVSSGVYVDSVMENSAASKAGIRPGDVITSIDGRNVSKNAELQELVARHRPGDKVILTINRKGKEQSVTATLQTRAGLSTVAALSSSGTLRELGASFQDADDETLEKLELSGGVQVRDLRHGKLQSAGVKEGFIITAVDGKRVKNVKELEKALSGKKGGVMLEGYYEDRPGVYYYAFGL